MGDPARLVVVESPYSAPTPEGIAANEAYARACLRDCLARGEAPIASHLLLTQPGVLNDRDPRTAPLPGDKLRGPRGGYRWVEAVVCGLHAQRMLVVYLGAHGLPYACTLREWQRWGQRASVDRAAPTRR